MTNSLEYPRLFNDMKWKRGVNQLAKWINTFEHFSLYAKRTLWLSPGAKLWEERVSEKKKDERQEEKEMRETDKRGGVKKASSVPAKVKPHTDRRVEEEQPLINNDIIY